MLDMIFLYKENKQETQQSLCLSLAPHFTRPPLEELRSACRTAKVLLAEYVHLITAYIVLYIRAYSPVGHLVVFVVQ